MEPWNQQVLGKSTPGRCFPVVDNVLHKPFECKALLLHGCSAVQRQSLYHLLVITREGEHKSVHLKHQLLIIATINGKQDKLSDDKFFHSP